MGWIGWVGLGALGILVVGWLAVSFRQPGPRRVPLEWISATAMFLALAALFAHLVEGALEAESRLRLFAFGFLLALFAAGFLVSSAQTLLALRGERKAGPSATN
jgi:hypothetical protein